MTDRPHVHINVAATADGKIDTFERRGAAISSALDKDRVDRLRAAADAVMVGGRTLLDEDPKLTVKAEALRAGRLARGLPSNPAKVGIVSRVDLKLDSAFLTSGPARILIFTTSQTPPEQLDLLRGRGVELFVGTGRRVDLKDALKTLKELGVERLMVEGGAMLNYELLRLKLVDELTIYVAPVIFGGGSSPTLADGGGLVQNEAIPLKLVEVEGWEDGGALLHYKLSE